MAKYTCTRCGKEIAKMGVEDEDCTCYDCMQEIIKNTPKYEPEKE